MRSPAAALGTGRRQLSEADLHQSLRVIRRAGAAYLILIGGNDSADTSARLSAAAAASGAALTVVGVPKTIDNDLPEMDHTPGYPSVARYVAMATRDTAADARSTAGIDPVVILEVMGRNSGWIAAAASLARRGPGDAPHLIYTPERPLSAGQLLADVKACHQANGHVVIVVTETVRDERGQPWASAPEMDAFGHPRLVGAAERLCALVRGELGLRARFNKPGTLQRSSSVCASELDRREAYAVGAAAVQAALQVQGGQMVTLLRLPGEPYRSFTALAPLEAIANRERHMPDAYLAAAGNDVTPAFVEYLRPLLGGRVPAYPRLRLERVALPAKAESGRLRRSVDHRRCGPA
jgi:6-phosphofructokinase 1